MLFPEKMIYPHRFRPKGNEICFPLLARGRWRQHFFLLRRRKKRLAKKEEPQRGFTPLIPQKPARANIRLRLFAIIADTKGNDWSGPGRNAANRPRCAGGFPQSGTAPAGRPTPCGWTRSAAIATTSVTRDYPPHPESLISFHSSTVKETVRRHKGDNRKHPGNAGPIGRLRPGPTDR